MRTVQSAFAGWPVVALRVPCVRGPALSRHLLAPCRCACSGDWERAWAVFGGMKQAGLQPRCDECILLWRHVASVIWPAIRTTSSDSTPHSVPHCSTISYNALLSACERCGQPDRALELLGRMQRDGIAQSAVT